MNGGIVLLIFMFSYAYVSVFPFTSHIHVSHGFTAVISLFGIFLFYSLKGVFRAVSVVRDVRFKREVVVQ